MKNNKKIFIVMVALLIVVIPIILLSLKESKNPTENNTESTSKEKEASKENETTVVYSVEDNATILKSTTLLAPITNEENSQNKGLLSKSERNKIISFTENLTKQTLLDSDDGENIICSPLSCYSALSMCAQLTDGESESQLLSVLNVEDLTELQKVNSNILKNLSFKLSDKEEELSFANSFWINSEQIDPNDKEQVNLECLDLLAEYYNADTITAEFSKDNAAKAMSGWVSEKTKNLLNIPPERFSDINNSMASIINTIYYKSSWERAFLEGGTKEGSFYLENGKTVQTKYMTEKEAGQLYEDEDCIVYSRKLENGTMHFILPTDDINIKDLFLQENYINDILGKIEKDSYYYDKVDLRIPKFNFKSKFDLKKSMQSLGVEDIFGAKANFSRFSNQEMYVRDILQEARIVLDEKGCTAAAYTFLAVATGFDENKLVEFYLDRPFGFIIEYEGVPLFVGIVNNPND